MNDNSIHLKTSARPTPYCLVSYTTFTTQHLHPHFEISYIVKGRYVYSVKDSTYELQAGDIFFSPPYSLHSFQVQSEEYERLIVAFTAEDLGLISDLLQDNLLMRARLLRCYLSAVHILSSCLCSRCISASKNTLSLCASTTQKPYYGKRIVLLPRFRAKQDSAAFARLTVCSTSTSTQPRRSGEMPTENKIKRERPIGYEMKK